MAISDVTRRRRRGQGQLTGPLPPPLLRGLLRAHQLDDEHNNSIYFIAKIVAEITVK